MGRGGEEGEIEIEHGIIFPSSSLKLQGPCLSFPLRRLICPPAPPPLPLPCSGGLNLLIVAVGIQGKRRAEETGWAPPPFPFPSLRRR